MLFHANALPNDEEGAKKFESDAKYSPIFAATNVSMQLSAHIMLLLAIVKA